MILLKETPIETVIPNSRLMRSLISLNKKYAPIPVQEEDEFRIAGIVVG